jgi:hypothetical protein
MSNKVRYVHVHGPALTGPLTFSCWSQAATLREKAKKNIHNGGFTIRVSHENSPLMAIAICSFSDRFEKALGRKAADSIVDRSRYAGDTVLVPSVQGHTALLRAYALRKALQLWINLGWDLDSFSIGVIGSKVKGDRVQEC